MAFPEAIGRAIDRMYVRPVTTLVSRETFRYAVCGVATYLVFDPVWYALMYNGVVRYRFFDLGFVVLSPHIAALALTVPLTFFVGFWLNGRVVFNRSTVPHGAQLARYALSVAGAMALTYAGMKIFVEACGIWPTPAKVLTTVLTTVYSFLAAKFFTFRRAR